MHTLLIVVFVLAYLAIAFEHPLRVNKSASALLGAGIMWTIYAVATDNHHLVTEQLNENLAATAQIIFFLLGAMTIVELVDAHDGFEVITSRITTTSQSVLIVLIGIVTFFLSAMLDNLTTTIVMVSLTKKLLDNHDDRLIFVGIIVIAANAGGAWSPIGDVTTTMLWIGGQISSVGVIKSVFLASVANLIIPLIVVSFMLHGKIVGKKAESVGPGISTKFERNLMFTVGLGSLVMVPVFKEITHLPPFMGILCGLGVLWLIGELVHRNKPDEEKQPLTMVHALSRIDMPSILFFIGILLAVSTLEDSHILPSLAAWLNQAIGEQSIIVAVIGVISSIIDNVPLVAASMGMYDIHQFGTDNFLWTFLAFCAGTGGSLLIIGSAAGVAAMGLEKINFFWYVKKISGLAILGYIAGILVFLVQFKLLHG
ncbi:sodium:proton antiporter [Desulfobacter hydrogenophilus]|uniref:Sodium:proton antiporter n=1 Tax=Desulfobacter hydrogenophilus TaxID=2291 RepID=A0A328FCG1_9BACT|nr:sodium:proton antiporter NhaD [Desulfobacter hydrogenophilus]NDY71739.1 sodium:proton antiporter [Desulfobacter hydrogenophilus]QBH13246.1 sodium:proton antiporter [Desulfobacter hydrogenophilus]RAM02331.1 sodium:proton antiporter [Desulfobacter hydrogenophilus]